MTRSAGWLFASGALLVGAGRLFGIEEFYGLGLVGPILVIVSWVRVRTTRATLVASRRIEPRLPTAGEDVQVRLTVATTDRSPSCDVEDLLPLEGRVVLALGSMPAGASTTASYRVPTSRRGRIKVGPATGVLSDPFGLASRRHRLAEREEIIVQPRWWSMSWVRPGEGVGPLDRAILRMASGFGRDDLRGMRAFRTGDDRRAIDWKASARRGSPVVREFEERSPVVVELVLLSMTTGGFTDDGFERAVSGVRSFVEAEAAAGFTTAMRVVPPTGTVVPVTSDTIDEVRRMLATITGDTDPLLPAPTSGELVVSVRFAGTRADLSDARSRRVAATLYFDHPSIGSFDQPVERRDGRDFAAVAVHDPADAWSSLSRPSGVEAGRR